MTSWTRALLFNAAGGLVLPVLLIWLDYNLTWKELWQTTVFSMIFAQSIGITCKIAFTAAVPTFSRYPRVWIWPAVLVLLVLCAFLGTAIGVTGIMLMPFHPNTSWLSLYRNSMRFTLPIGVGVGIVFGIVDDIRSHLRTNALQLRTKELERERAEKLAAEARLSSLESRVHPHFLFNALNSISALLREDVAAAERLIERLAALLRFSLDAHNGPVKVCQELKVVADYLEIERARFGDRLRYSIDAPDELSERLVPAMSIQTLVENSVKYAIAPRREGGLVRVTVRASGAALEVEVHDDGPGIPLDAVRQGHGLDILQERLKAMFGAGAALRIQGSSATFVVPA